MNLQNLFQISIYHGYILQILLAEVLYLGTLRPREHFFLRAAVGVPVYGVLAIVIPNFVAQYVSGFFSLIIFVLSLGLCVFCFQSSFQKILFCCVAAQLTQNLSYNVENLIYRPFAEFFSGIRWLILSVGVTVVVYTIAYFVFARRLGERRQSAMKGTYILCFPSLPRCSYTPCSISSRNTKSTCFG